MSNFKLIILCSLLSEVKKVSKFPDCLQCLRIPGLSCYLLFFPRTAFLQKENVFPPALFCQKPFALPLFCQLNLFLKCISRESLPSLCYKEVAVGVFKQSSWKRVVFFCFYLKTIENERYVSQDRVFNRPCSTGIQYSIRNCLPCVFPSV